MDELIQSVERKNWQFSIGKCLLTVLVHFQIGVRRASGPQLSLCVAGVRPCTLTTSGDLPSFALGPPDQHLGREYDLQRKEDCFSNPGKPLMKCSDHPFISHLIPAWMSEPLF